ncbi:helix-turn-helix domain-containing protein [Fodinibacter luteus]|uniref:helix-turn-helix domain-containing protein n=1 Tax=Fodinibacter luteus TaxID=552064 RepID=UPI003CCC5226
MSPLICRLRSRHCSGRHQNKALAASRRTRAVELRSEGWTYDAIADELGYAHRATVYTIVHRKSTARPGGPRDAVALEHGEHAGEPHPRTVA